MAEKALAPEVNLATLTEAVTAAVLRAVAAREEAQHILRRDDATLIMAPWVRFGGMIALGRGQLQGLISKAGEAQIGG